MVILQRPPYWRRDADAGRGPGRDRTEDGGSSDTGERGGAENPPTHRDDASIATGTEETCAGSHRCRARDQPGGVRCFLLQRYGQIGREVPSVYPVWRFPGSLQPFRDAEEYRCVRTDIQRSEEHTSELQSRLHLVCRLLL